MGDRENHWRGWAQGTVMILGLHHGVWTWENKTRKWWAHRKGWAGKLGLGGGRGPAPGRVYRQKKQQEKILSLSLDGGMDIWGTPSASLPLAS